MLAGNAQSLDRRAVIGLSLINDMVVEPPEGQVSKETAMKISLPVMSTLLGLLTILMPISAHAQPAKGKNCRMEQQCHWENFKKVCVNVKVCR
jgi:hypothetical protein